jgi:hypothetical protein
MRPNYAQDAPPTVITVGGFAYPVDVDYRTWIRATRMLQDFISQPETPEQAQHNAELLCELQVLVFGGVLKDEDPSETVKGIADFARGYPNAPVVPDGKQHDPIYSFEYDLNYIILAIRNQTGIDLSFRRKEPFHWWEFLLEFSSLCGDHYILRLMEIRGYDGKDVDARRQKARYALPRETTAGQEALLEDINAEFYGAGG